MIGAVDTLQFIDSMTGRLAWPLAAITLGIIFRRSLGQLLSRVRRLKWGEGEAELAELAEATEDVQQAIEEVGKPLPEEESERDATYRARIERLVQDAAEWGIKLGALGWDTAAPILTIEWEGNQPHLQVTASDYEDRLVKDLRQYENLQRHAPNEAKRHRAKINAGVTRLMLHNLREARRDLERSKDSDA